MDYIALKHWVSKRVTKQAGSSLIHSPSRSRGHSSCRRHPALHCFPFRKGALDLRWPWSYHLFLHLLVNLDRPSYPVLLPIFRLCLPSYRIKLHVLQLQSQTGSPRHMVRNSIADVKDDNTIRPGFNNASAAVKPLHLHGWQPESIWLYLSIAVIFKLPLGMGYVTEKIMIMSQRSQKPRFFSAAFLPHP